jgi:hypothetical protein
MLGHASAAMTLDVHSGLFDDDLTALAERMDAASRAAAEARVGAVWARPLTERPEGGKTARQTVGPEGIEPSTRGLKEPRGGVRRSARPYKIAGQRRARPAADRPERP